MAEPDSYELTILCELWTVNAERRMHWRTRNDLVQQARWAAKIEALRLKLPSFRRVSITVEPMQGRGVLADPGAHEPVVKACVDGLCDARVLSNDTGQQVANIDSLPPMRAVTGLTGLKMILTPVVLTG